MTGLIAFTGKDAGEKQFTVTYVGHLSQSTRTQSRGSRGRAGFPGPPMPSFFGRGVSFGGLSRTTNTVVVGEHGNILSLTGQSQLPWLLGNLSLMPFEALPKTGQTEWQVGSGISVTEEEESPFFGGPFRGNTRTKVGGKESAEYKIVKDEGTLVTIQKTYHLTSPAAGKDDEATEINGTGTFVFNTELNCSESLEMKQTLVISKEGSNISVPMTIAWHRIPQEEWEAEETKRNDMIAKAQQENAERQAKADAAAKEAEGKKLDPKKKEEIMRDLNAKHWPDVASRLRSLKRFVPHPDDFDVALRIKELQTHNVLSVYKEARDLWIKLDPIVEAGRKEAAMTKSDGDNPFATPDEKLAADAQAMREWSDATGSFKVEAAFVKFDGDNIVLKRKDGKELNVPINRLSEADQKVAATLKKNAPTKTENPFE
ncbi:MAG: SHD1 domain-containing protein [Planctomycetaceae bacterium]